MHNAHQLRRFLLLLTKIQCILVDLAVRLILGRNGREDALDLMMARVAVRGAKPVVEGGHLELLLVPQELRVLAGDHVLVADHVALVLTATLLASLQAVIVKQTERILAPGATADDEP